jgi:pyruvate dehydrogenase E2 component (dihydrolipoamide acetyltransferase)
MAGRNEVRVPDIGDFEGVEIIEVHVQQGATVAAEDPLITLETDKASMDVPAPAAGKVAEVRVAKGDRVSEGDVIVVLEGAEASGGDDKKSEESDKSRKSEQSEQDAKAAKDDQADKPEQASKTETPARAEQPERSEKPGRTAYAPPQLGPQAGADVHAGPSVRKFAREMGVDLSRVKGSGVKGRITHDDVKAWVKNALQSGAGAGGGTGLPAVPEVDFSKFGPTELKPLSRVQRISGPRLHASWVNLPHVTQFDEADITETERARKELKADAEK